MLPAKIGIESRRKLFGILTAGLLLSSALPARAADALQFFKNYFITGDYVVGGVGLRGKGKVDLQTKAIVGGSNSLYATGTININGVPENADVLTALLYWGSIEGTPQAISSAGAFRGFRISGKQVGSAAAACWGSGGGSGTTVGGQEFSRLQSRCAPLSAHRE